MTSQRVQKVPKRKEGARKLSLRRGITIKIFPDAGRDGLGQYNFAATEQADPEKNLGAIERDYNR